MQIVLHIIITLLLMPWGGFVIMSPMMFAAPGFQDNKQSILSVVLFFGYPVIIFAILKLFNFHYFGIAASSWLLWSFVIIAIIILISGIPKLLYNIGRGIPNTGYFKTETSVYLNGRIITDALPHTFKSFEEDSTYARDEQHVFYNGKIIIDADPTTFHSLNIVSPEETPFPLYWKDSLHVYVDGKALTDCDAATFSCIYQGYGRDASKVYYRDKILPGADPETFLLITSVVGRDDTSLFVFDKRVTEAVNLQTFEIVKHEEGDFCKDKNHIYIIFYHLDDPLVKVSGADPNTFLPMGRDYARDHSNVFFYGYYKGKKTRAFKLEGVNPDSFSVGYDESTDSEATDGKKYFMYGELVRS